MIKQLEITLKELSLIPGLSGHEQLVSNYMESKFKGMGLEVNKDVLGNTSACIPGNERRLKVLVTSHMDSLGFVVKYITDKGFLKLDRVGGIPEKTIPALRVVVQTEDNTFIQGVIGTKSHHVTPAEEKYVVDKYTELFVDLGCKSRQEVYDLGIDVGCPVLYEPSFYKLQNTRVSGTSFDNRAACTALIHLAERFIDSPANCDVYFAGTVQEEYTIRGASLAARLLEPDIVICLDVAIDGDTPDLESTSHVSLGGGAVMCLYNFHGRGTLNGTIPHPSLVKLFKETAKENGLKLQRGTLFGGLSELAYMQLEGKGIAGIDIDIPCRYTHTQIETIDLTDILSVINLCEMAIRKIDSTFSITR